MTPLEQLYRAMKDGRDEEVALLLRANPGLPTHPADGCVAVPLISAVFSYKPRFVRLLLEAGADPELREINGKGSAYNLRPIDAAELVRQNACRRALELAGSAPDFTTWVLRGNTNHVRKELDRDPSLLHTRMVRPAWTLMHVAAEMGDAPVTHLLLDRGLGADAPDESGHHPLRFAARNAPAIDVMKALVEAGAELDHQSSTGITALASACRHRDSAPSALWLLDAGADPNLVAKDGKSPLIRATANRVAAVVEALLAAGADASHKGPRRETALDIARRKRSTDVVALLERH